MLIKNKKAKTLMLTLLLLFMSFNEVLAVYTNPNAEVEKITREYFADLPIMIEVAKCESEFRQFFDSGEVLYGGHKNNMIGLMQFSEFYHLKPAKKLGYDIKTLQGNLDYARYIYEREGLTPWNASKHCWGKTKAAKNYYKNLKDDKRNIKQKNKDDEQTNNKNDGVKNNKKIKLTNKNSRKNSDNKKVRNVVNIEKRIERDAAFKPITRRLIIGSNNPQVKILQKLLNRIGFTVSKNGGGSLGKETNFFGPKTRDAVRKFQCAYNIVCSGNEYTTGYGFVGKETRDTINSLMADNKKFDQQFNKNTPEMVVNNEHSKRLLEEKIKILLKQIEVLKRQLESKRNELR